MTDTLNPPSDQQFLTDDDLREDERFWLAERRIAALRGAVKEACRRFAIEQRDPRAIDGAAGEALQLFLRRDRFPALGSQEPTTLELVAEIAALIDASGLPFDLSTTGEIVCRAILEVEAELKAQCA